MVYGCHFAIKYLGISEESRGPTWTFQPLSSSISRWIRDALPGMIICLCLTLPSMPDALIAICNFFAVSFRPATPRQWQHLQCQQRSGRR